MMLSGGASMFDEQAFADALKVYAARERRFGGR